MGDYTAGAIASISFGLPVPAVDGNVLRVFSRLYADGGDVTSPAVKRAFTARVMEHQPQDKPGDYNQALMELGALVCLPGGEPQCSVCPLAGLCRAHLAGQETAYPVKPPKKARRKLPVTVALVRGPQGWLLQRRPETGLLAGLWQPLLWEEALTQEQLAQKLAELGLAGTDWQPLPAAKHIFSHLEWQLGGFECRAADGCAPAGCVWADEAALAGEYALPGAFKAYRKRMMQG